MIWTEKEYRASLKKLRQNEEALEKPRKHLEDMGLTTAFINSPIQQEALSHKREKQDKDFYNLSASMLGTTISSGCTFVCTIC